ncbi:MAG: hypothetical protein HQK88_07970 [Nitrospirae bacterium]|nr:hypothetical protein [Nitrospirota bacterium]MBF0533611.1 hypothetical protein [Nitrospirota bacterium]MBF0616738.1 hypothetical protein [Nitrospirota bacterium]
MATGQRKETKYEIVSCPKTNEKFEFAIVVISQKSFMTETYGQDTCRVPIEIRCPGFPACDIGQMKNCSLDEKLRTKYRYPYSSPK